MAARQRTIQVTLPAEIYDQIEAVAAQTGRTVAAVLVEAVIRQFAAPSNQGPAALDGLPDDELWEKLHQVLSPDDQPSAELIYANQERELTPAEQATLDELQHRLQLQHPATAAVLAVLRQRALEDLEDERRWQAAFAKSLHVLEKMADEILADHEAGRTEELDPDTL